MKLNRTRKMFLAWSLVLLVPLGLYATQASLAGDEPSTQTLIDKDFESSLRKFISKRFYRRINATQEQREKLEAIWTSTMESTRPQREELRHEFLDFSTLMASDQATDDQIMQKAHEMRALHEKVMDERLASLLKARKILTQEQRQKMHDRLSDFVTGGGPGARRIGMILDR